MSKDWGERDHSDSFESGGGGDGQSGSGSDSGGHLLLDLELDDDEDSSSDEEEPGFFIKVETIIGSGFRVYAYASDTIELLKTRIAFQEGIPQKEQNLFISHGKIALNNPKTLLADVGLNEFTAVSRPLRLVTNISSGVGSKGFLTRDSSPPPLTFAPLPFIPTVATLPSLNTNNSSRKNKERKTQEGPPDSYHTRNSVVSDDEPLKLPRLGLDDESIDGVIVFKDKDDRRVFFIIKKKPSDETTKKPSSNKTIKRSQMMSNAIDEIENRRLRILEEEMRRGGQISGRRECQKQLERIRENAKTLQKMNEIRKTLLTKKKLVPLNLGLSGHGDHDDRENELPDIYAKSSQHKGTQKLPSSNRTTKTRTVSTSTSTTFNRTITSSMASLNRLKAEIYLEAKKTGGGSFGVLPYTNAQLCRYVQLKVKVILANQNPEEYDEFNISHRFVPKTEPKTIIPTVVVKRQLELSKTLATARKSGGRTGRRSNLRSATTGFGILSGRRRDSSSSSTCGSDVSLLKERNTKSRIATARMIASDESIKSGKLRRQKSQTGGMNKSGSMSVRNLRSDGAHQGTSSTIQKKKKDTVRCFECRKKIGVACRYQCRCGKIFCSVHRYAEAHVCTFDYKTAGRKQLQDANPVVVASKVDKI